MDTGTHFVIGISLAGLSSIDPAITNNHTLSQVVLLGTVIGSQAPDLDGITRFFGGTCSYIKSHRGITHSLLAIIIWPIVISSLIMLFYPSIPYFHLVFWTFVAVLVHIILDIFNSYGTQALRPFSQKWIALNIINIFDPFIFIIHIIAILIWSLQKFNSVYIFSTVYLLTIIYLVVRTWAYYNTLNRLRYLHKITGKLIMLPTIRWSVWNVIQKTPSKYNIGVVRNKKLQWIESRVLPKKHKAIEASKLDKKVKVLLNFSNYTYPEWKKTPFGYEVHWFDLRYRFNNHYPLLAIVLLDESYQIIDSYIGWTYNQGQISKKVDILIKQHL
ncbi:hypothetical protein BHF71_09675 [Vulcanibacillus modesticaldus]|uniref:Hydrolase n=1 Tax=Vulcanibacillus modesticaldus TaxID=337097 RepID=A0A1D2YU21_9BACI|nr:metal-dependent hydrolase [Vulcanibacillus modesticaldus]OEF99208.1 hypothetical protein BHF71_09675 [Vulcanibacillus modesticaldus]